MSNNPQFALTLEPQHSRRPELSNEERELIDRAIRCLEEGRASAPGSPIEERARSLELRSLRELGRRTEREVAVSEYLRRFPDTHTARRLRAERR